MRLTIVPIDGIVIIDGEARRVDCSSVNPTVHAVQWYDVAGEVEFKDVEGGGRPANLKIEDITPYQSLVDAWYKAPPLISLPPEVQHA